MGYAAMQDDPETLPKPEARDRIHDARVSQFAFLVRKISNVTLDDDDVMQLAVALADVFDGNDAISRAELEGRLKKAGQPSAKVAQLVGAIFK